MGRKKPLAQISDLKTSCGNVPFPGRNSNIMNTLRRIASIILARKNTDARDICATFGTRNGNMTRISRVLFPTSPSSSIKVSSRIRIHKSRVGDSLANLGNVPFVESQSSHKESSLLKETKKRGRIRKKRKVDRSFKRDEMPNKPRAKSLERNNTAERGRNRRQKVASMRRSRSMESSILMNLHLLEKTDSIVPRKKRSIEGRSKDGEGFQNKENSNPLVEDLQKSSRRESPTRCCVFENLPIAGKTYNVLSISPHKLSMKKRCTKEDIDRKYKHMNSPQAETIHHKPLVVKLTPQLKNKTSEELGEESKEKVDEYIESVSMSPAVGYKFAQNSNKPTPSYEPENTEGDIIIRLRSAENCIDKSLVCQVTPIDNSSQNPTNQIPCSCDRNSLEDMRNKKAKSDDAIISMKEVVRFTETATSSSRRRSRRQSHPVDRFNPTSTKNRKRKIPSKKDEIPDSNTAAMDKNNTSGGSKSLRRSIRKRQLTNRFTVTFSRRNSSVRKRKRGSNKEDSFCNEKINAEAENDQISDRVATNNDSRGEKSDSNESHLSYHTNSKLQESLCRVSSARGSCEATSQIWSDAEIQRLKNAHTATNPLSPTFWFDISNSVLSKSAEECQEKWNSMIGTPLLKKAGSSKQCKNTFSDGDDDIFDSTPIRRSSAWKMLLLNSSELPKIRRKRGLSDICSSPLVMSKKEKNKNIGEVVSPALFRPQYKSYLKEVGNGIKGKIFASKSIISRNIKELASLSTFVDDGDLKLGGTLSPGGHVHIDDHTDASEDSDSYIQSTE